jgi:hypothetical protein
LSAGDDPHAVMLPRRRAIAMLIPVKPRIVRTHDRED